MRLRPSRLAALLVIAALLGGCGAHSATPGKKSSPPRHHAPKVAGTTVRIAGYSTKVPTTAFENTPSVTAALTPYGLVWSSYADAQDHGGTFELPHPYAIFLSPGGGRGLLDTSGLLLALVPQSVHGQAVDLHLVGATGPYLAFTLDVAGTVTTLSAGTVDLRTGQVRMVPGTAAAASGVLVGGGLVGLIAPQATYVFNPADGALATYPAAVAADLGRDLAYGLPIGSVLPPGRTLPGVVSYSADGQVLYGPPGFALSVLSTRDGWTIWQLTDPRDPDAVIRLQENSCMGCTTIGVVAGALEAPSPSVPNALDPPLSSRWLSDWALGYSGSVPGYRYPVQGVDIAPVPGGSGSENVAVSLPKTEASLAWRILESYGIPH